MERNLEEIITYMHDRFRPYEVFDKQMKKITRELMERGYTLEEISRGINAYLIQLEPQGTDLRSSGKEVRREATFRILDPAERRFVGRDAYGYISLMRELGLISSAETEEVIGYIVDNRLEVESAEQVQSVMMELIDDEEDFAFGDTADEEEERGRPVLWHNIRKKRLN